MKDSRFIELLNLYVDREITPAEAAELEAEVQANEQRRRVYNQYCRIDRACTVVLAQGGKVPAPKLAAAIADARQDDSEFAICHACPRLRRVNGDRDADGAGESPEIPLDQVKTGRATTAEIRAFLLAHDQHHALLEENAHRLRAHARKIQHDLDRSLGLKDIDDRHAFAGHKLATIGPFPGQIFQELLDVGRQIQRLIERARRKGRHTAILNG